MIVGGAGVVFPEPATTIGGVAVFAYSADQWMTGVKTAYYGTPHRTVTAQISGAAGTSLAEAAGYPPQQAAQLGDHFGNGIDMAAGLLGPPKVSQTISATPSSASFLTSRFSRADVCPPTRLPVPRVGTNSNAVEVTVKDLSPIHPVPRVGKEADIPALKTQIGANGYDIGKPISATRLPNGDLIVTGGHHRLEAMKQLGEKTVPVQIYDAAADPVRTARNLGIGRITGQYKGDYMPTITAEQQALVNKYLSDWRKANGY